MRKVGIFYGTTTSNTLDAVELLQGAFEVLGIQGDDFDIGESDLGGLVNYDYLVLGCPTWDDGELQADWEIGVEDLEKYDLTGKVVALLGLGDAAGYPLTFVDALKPIADVVRKQGGRIVGLWPIDEYEFMESKAIEDGKFLGLILDIENQMEMNDERVEAWAKQLQAEFFEQAATAE